jgi:glycosyltransferase involved in cell wall biosynthesis
MEMSCVKQSSFSLFVNNDEAAFWRKYGNVFALPFGVDDTLLHYDQKSDTYSNVVAFFGRMDYMPNIDAVKWFCQNVLPQINPNLEFWIIGAHPTEAVKKLAALYDKVKVIGFIEDPYLILRSCVCTVTPMQSGGGLLTKILSSMAVESVVLSSTFPMDGIPGAENDVHLFIENNPDRFAQKINEIYDNPADYDLIRKNARIFIKNNFSWKAVEEKTVLYIDQFTTAVN